MSTPTPPPSGLPRFFLDRNLGRYAVPRGLREAGIEVVSLAERYGVPADEQITDVEWMRDAAAAGDAVLMCDDAIRKKNPEERRVLVEMRLQAFVVNSQLPAADVVTRFLTNLRDIERACRRPGPFVYRLHPKQDREPANQALTSGSADVRSSSDRRSALQRRGRSLGRQ